MATGDIDDFRARLRAQLPWNWFPDDAPVLDTVLQGLAAVWEWAYALVAYVKLQTRIKTATGSNLDIAGLDFFGDSLARKPQEGDEAYRRRILINLFRERVTRNGMYQALLDLTGTPPIIIEPGRLADTGGWSTYGAAYSAAGVYGSQSLAYQCFITVFIKPGQGVAGIAGYNTTYSGYGTQRSAWISAEMLRSQITQQDVLDVINATKAEGITCWVRIIIGNNQ